MVRPDYRGSLRRYSSEFFVYGRSFFIHELTTPQCSLPAPYRLSFSKDGKVCYAISYLNNLTSFEYDQV